MGVPSNHLRTWRENNRVLNFVALGSTSSSSDVERVINAENEYSRISWSGRSTTIKYHTVHNRWVTVGKFWKQVIICMIGGYLHINNRLGSVDAIFIRYLVCSVHTLATLWSVLLHHQRGSTLPTTDKMAMKKDMRREDLSKISNRSPKSYGLYDNHRQSSLTKSRLRRRVHLISAALWAVRYQWRLCSQEINT